MKITKAAILGATGVTGKHIARELVRRGISTRVVSRSGSRLQAAFQRQGGEIHAADLSDPKAAVAAIHSCDVLFHCVGVPMDRFRDHIAISRNVVEATEKTGCRAVLITSYWPYGPVDSGSIDESSARRPVSNKEKIRRDQEQMFRSAGAIVCLLPDFYGPEADITMVNPALRAVCEGKRANWIGDLDKPRQFIFVPDSAFPVVELAGHDEAYGDSWNVAPSGPTTARALLQSAARQCGTKVKVRVANRPILTLLSLVNSQIRGIKDLYPLFMSPPVLDGGKLRRLIGDFPATPYEAGVRQTLDWLRRQ